MSKSNYSSVKEKSNEVAAILKDFSLLIGQQREKPTSLETGGEIIPGLGFTSDAIALASRAHDIQQGIFKIIVLGEFKHGKSTLLNSMLGGKTLPAKATPCTAIITCLVYGESKNVAVYEVDKETPRFLSWETFKSEFQLNREDQEKLDRQGFLDRFQNIDYAQIECQHSLCANGVKLIDSPGLKESNSRTKVTYRFLKQSQAVIFVLSATQILSEDEREFIANVLGKGRLTNVFFVVNRIDLLQNSFYGIVAGFTFPAYRELMNYKTAKLLTSAKFKRRFGVQPKTFNRMVKAMKDQRPKQRFSGRPSVLSVEEQILVTLEYWREYRTYFHIATDWGISESTVCRIVHRVEHRLMESGQFRLPGKKRLVLGFGRPEVVVMDVTETPIERPKRKQRLFYSGKKKQHTLKCQIILDRDTGEIICTFFGSGRSHDFNLFKASGIHFHPETESIEDSGYQGISQFHANCYVPKKKPKNGELSSLERAYNHALGQERVCIEHVNRRLKIFKILAQRYRNRRRRYGLRCNLIAAIYNFELSSAV